MVTGVVTLPSTTATAADNCTSTPNVTYSQTTFTCSDLGANTVTVTAADANGNVATQTFTVTVEDNIAPTVTMLSTFADVALDANGAASISINNLASNVSDNCGTPTVTITPNTFSCIRIRRQHGNCYGYRCFWKHNNATSNYYSS